MWFELSLGSALFFGIRRIFEKRFVGTYGNFSLGFLLQVFALPVMLVFLLFYPTPHDLLALPWEFWWPLIIIWLVLYPLQTYFLYRSLREGELSQVVPINALLPVFNVITSYILIGELPTVHGGFGILIIVIGTFLLLIQSQGGKIALHKPALFMMISMMAPALGSTLDKISIHASDIAIYSVMNNLGASVMFFILMFAFGQHGDLRRAKGEWHLFALLGLVLAFSYLTAMAAFRLENTSYVLAIRSVGFLLPVLWGFAYLHESVTWKKIAAITAIFFGVFLLAI